MISVLILKTYVHAHMLFQGITRTRLIISYGVIMYMVPIFALVSHWNECYRSNNTENVEYNQLKFRSFFMNLCSSLIFIFTWKYFMFRINLVVHHIWYTFCDLMKISLAKYRHVRHSLHIMLNYKNIYIPHLSLPQFFQVCV